MFNPYTTVDKVFITLGRGISMLCPSDEIRQFVVAETIKSKIRRCRCARIPACDKPMYLRMVN